MINIHKRVVKRQITEEEFLLLKGIEPFATFRQDSKACFPGDTKINIEGRGWIELNKIIPEINRNQFIKNKDSSLKVLTPSGDYSPVLYTVYGETNEWIEFELDNGDCLKMTPNHI